MKVAKHLALLAVLFTLLALVACDLEDVKITVDPAEKATVAESGTPDEEAATTPKAEETTAAPHEHSYSEATCTKPGTCECGKTYGDKLGHDFAEATCTTPKICNRCGVAEGKSLSHDYSSATCTTAKTCDRCGLVSGEALGHDFTAANCTNPEICKRCELAQGSALGHDFAEATCTAPETCKTCGATGAAAKGHTYTNDVCIRCGEVDPDSLPVGLEELHLMDSAYYEFVDKITDSFGNEYEKAHIYEWPRMQDEPWSIHALSKKYSVFEGTIVAINSTEADIYIDIKIYVDDKLVYSYDDYTIIAGALDFSIDVSNASSIKIFFKDNQYYDHSGGIALVNAQLYK